MARQPKTRQPKAKFAKPCMDCGKMVVSRVINGVLIKACDCKR